MTIARPAVAARQQPQAIPYPPQRDFELTPKPAANIDLTPRAVVVRRQWLAADDIKGIELEAADGMPLPPAQAGAHIDLHLPDGTVRQYSLTNPDPAPMHYRIAVLRAPDSRGGSRYIVDELAAGATLTLSGPRNHFELDETAADYCLIAGGIGITPVLAMARRLLELGHAFEFHYLVRDRNRAAFLDELQALVPAAALHLHVESESGRPDLAALIGTAADNRHVYTCGPAGLLDAMQHATAEWPAEQVHFERFANTALQQAPESDAGPCAVTLQQSGRGFELQPDETLLEALERNDIDMPCCCREGICGTCAVGVIDGEVDHRDGLQDEEEKAMNDVMYVCVSRPTGSHLVLDL